MIKENLIEVLHEMEEVAKLFKLAAFDIYILGGSACGKGDGSKFHFSEAN